MAINLTKKINGYGNSGSVCGILTSENTIIAREYRIYGLLGLAAKKGSIVSGADACEHALKNGVRATDNAVGGGLLIVADDASDNTRAKFSDAALCAGMEFRNFGTRAELGRRTGKTARSVLIVTDTGLAAQITALIDKSADNVGNDPCVVPHKNDGLRLGGRNDGV